MRGAILESGLAPAPFDFALDFSVRLGKIENALVDQLVDRSNDHLEICLALRKGHVSTAEVAPVFVDDIDSVLSLRLVGNQYTDQLPLYLPELRVTWTNA